MRVAIIGDGLLGWSLLMHAAAEEQPGDLAVMTGHADYDITDPKSVDALLSAHRPDVVVNTAAIHAMAACEADPDRAFLVNARAQERLARLVPTIFISTDYVFGDGGPHTEVLPGQTPRSVYGRSKLAGELATLEHGGVVVRVSALFGHHRSHKGPTFPETMVGSADPIRLPTDQVFAPTYAPDAAERILQIARDPQRSGIYHVANRGYVSWADWGEHILAIARHKRHIIPVAMRDPLRPADSRLRNTRLEPTPHSSQALVRWAHREGRIEYVNPLRGEA